MPQEQSRFRPSAIPGMSRVSRRLDRAIAWRVEAALEPLRQRLDDHERRILRLERRLDEQLPDAVRAANRALSEVERVRPQASATEQRLEELRQRVETQLDPGTTAEQAEAARLVDVVRQEHERIRARMTAISWYEDRLRKLEDRISAPEDSPRA